MGKAERQGQNRWQRFIDAGVVEETLLWTDNPIEVDNTLGRTRDTLGLCWPIDAAVAYTLANHGPNAKLTWSDMVNQNTRIASVMMTGAVGYGKLLNPLSVSCGHDEVDTYDYYLPEISHHYDANGKKILCFASTRTYDSAKVPSEIRSMLSVRLTEDKPSWSINPNKTDYTVLCHLRALPKLFDWLCESHGADTFSLAGLQTEMIKRKTKGVCGFAEDDPNHGFCSHHDAPMKEDWYMIKESDSSGDWATIWYRGQGTVVHSGWNNDQFRSRYLTHQLKKSQIVVFDRVKRVAAQMIPEETVIKHIKESLNRMKNWDGRSLVEKHGRGKTAIHCWNSWEWLNEISVWVSDTHSKNRHENDTACRVCYAAGESEEDTNKPICRCGDGWKYVKYSSKQSYGHEMAKFEWRPIKQRSVYALGIGTKILGDYTCNTAKEAAYYRDMIVKMATKMPVAKLNNRVWDLSSGQEDIEISADSSGITIREIKVDVRMKWDKNPEDLPNAEEMKTMVMFGNPTEQNEAFDLCKQITATGRVDSSWNEKTQNIVPMVLKNTADNVINEQTGEN